MINKDNIKHISERTRLPVGFLTMVQSGRIKNLSEANKLAIELVTDDLDDIKAVEERNAELFMKYVDYKTHFENAVYEIMRYKKRNKLLWFIVLVMLITLIGVVV